ncbi:MAG: serine hydrolase, partial [Gemmatimonadetes bacterium]|nr:serine hydrolase [Gemmatimonadota bacterium]
MLTDMRLIPAPLRRRVLDAAEVPRDLGTVTSVAVADEQSPGPVGMTREDVAAIWGAVERLYATGMHPGISMVLRRGGRVVLKRAIGHARGNGPGDADETPVPMTPDTPVCIFSASKAMASMPLHLLSERKELSLLDPVSHYLPEFGQNGKRDITIYQLLCHKAGIPTV